MAICNNYYNIFRLPEVKACKLKNKYLSIINGNNDMNKNKIPNDVITFIPEYNILKAIEIFTNDNISFTDKVDLFMQLKCKHQYIQNVKIFPENIFIQTQNMNINVIKFSKLFCSLQKMLDEINSNNRYHECHQSSFIICLDLPENINSTLVTGYIYSFANKCKFLHSWVEIDMEGKQFALDYTINAACNIEGYYYLRHAEVLQKITSSDVKSDHNIFRKIFDKLTLKEYLVFRDELINDIKKSNII